MALRDSIKNLKLPEVTQEALKDPETRWVLLFLLIITIGAIAYGVRDQVKRPKLVSVKPAA